MAISDIFFAGLQFPNRRRRRAILDFLLAVTVFAVLLTGWELFARTGLVSLQFSSSPSQILASAGNLIQTGTLLHDIQVSGRTFALGYGLAIAVGVPLGVTLGWFRWINRAFSPLLSASYATPHIALLPLFIIWFGLGLGSQIAVVFLAAVFPLIFNMQTAMVNIDPDMKRVSEAYGASRWQFFRTIAIPYSLPFLLTGLRLACGHALVGTVAAEMFVGSDGLGYMINFAGSTFRSGMMFVGVIVVATFGIVMDRSLYFLNRYFDFWRNTDV
jgi:ABC-type nitrate/sulfonate/bicarbonate transport system permease component